MSVAHPTTVVTSPDGTLVPIDVGMVRLIEHLWRLGARTSKCCQGEPSKGIQASIQFVSWFDAMKLLPLHGVTVQIVFGREQWVRVSWEAMYTPLVETATGAP